VPPSRTSILPHALVFGQFGLTMTIVTGIATDPSPFTVIAVLPMLLSHFALPLGFRLVRHWHCPPLGFQASEVEGCLISSRPRLVLVLRMMRTTIIRHAVKVVVVIVFRVRLLSRRPLARQTTHIHQFLFLHCSLLSRGSVGLDYR